METFVRFAVSYGFSAYGFSSHAPLPYEAMWTLSKENMENYIQEFNRLKMAYADRIELFLGLEIDYLNEESNPASDYFQQLPLDFRIGSVHLLPNYKGEMIDMDVSVEKFRQVVDTHFNGDLDYVICLYYSQLRKMIRKGGFDIVGHVDKLHYNASMCRPGLLDENWYNRIVTDFFEEIAEKGYIVEVNTKAFLEKRTFFPNERYFPLFREMGVRMTVNSDAHCPDKINAGRKEGLTALKRAGFDSVAELHEGGWRQVPIVLD